MRTAPSNRGRAVSSAMTAFVVVGVGCGARSQLVASREEVAADAGDRFDAAEEDVISTDVAEERDADEASIDAPSHDTIEEPVACEDGQNTAFMPSDCGSGTGLWFAWPYSPTRDIWVQRIELHTAGGNLGVLTDANGLPGSVLFQGTMPATAMAQWIGVDVAPPLFLQAGVPYWLVEQSEVCSQALGGTQFIEYNAPTLGGPWTTTGTGSYTSHLYGVCQG
ncbi:MAG TPA: hypothetical protein VF765_12410 [Polyangiaceae bacterium]